MSAGGVLSRYLVKTHHHKSDILGLTELEGASQRSQNQKGLELRSLYPEFGFLFTMPHAGFTYFIKRYIYPFAYLAFFHVE